MFKKRGFWVATVFLLWLCLLGYFGYKKPYTLADLVKSPAMHACLRQHGYGEMASDSTLEITQATYYKLIACAKTG